MTPETSNKNQNIENPSPVYIRELPSYPTDDEISLVDLALVLMRRKFLILTILLLCIGVAIAYTATLSKNHTYTSHISIGSYVADGKIVPLDQPDNLLVKITHSFIPGVLSKPDYTFSLSASIIDKSNTIALVASSSHDQAKLMVNALNELNQLVIKDQDQLYKALLDQTSQPSTASYSAGEHALNKVSVHGLQSTYVLTEPRASGAAYSKNRKLIIIASVFAGLFLGIFAAFLAEFTSKVRAELNQSS